MISKYCSKGRTMYAFSMVETLPSSSALYLNLDIIYFVLEKAYDHDSSSELSKEPEYKDR